MGILRLSHVDISAPDLELAAAYYTQVLGLDIVERTDERLFFKCWDERDHHCLSIRYDPGKVLALGGAVAALAGLIASLMIRRRRVFVRVSSSETAGRSVVSVGGLAKGEDPRLGTTVEAVLSAIAERTGKTV